MSKKLNARTASAQILQRLRQQQGSLASEFPRFTRELDEQETRFAQELCYGVCRWYFLLENSLKPLLKKPFKAKDGDVYCLLLLGIYQLRFTRVAPHAAINETVNGALFFRKPWAKNVINGVLRAYQRASATVEHNDINDSISSHPKWLQQAIKKHWSEYADQLMLANNQHPPLTLRVNQQQASVSEYQQQLGSIEASPTPHSSVGLTLSQAVDVKTLPGFSDGSVSVQDEAAQLAGDLLQLAPGLRVLDACCAPGGKTCHIGEIQPKLEALVAVELEQRRLGRVHENLERLSIAADVICADAAKPEAWWDKQPFDRILLDAPCSATGVIRRQPDIKLLRTADNIRELVALQQRLLSALWPLLADGGILVYATCSILPAENTEQIERFIDTHPDAVHQPVEAVWGVAQTFGRQLLPQVGGHDGFYYACLVKQANAS